MTFFAILNQRTVCFVGLCVLLGNLDATTWTASGQETSDANIVSSESSSSDRLLKEYRLAYQVAAWRTLHMDDEGKADQQIATLKKLGCVTQRREHSGHIDVTFRCNEWKVLAIEEKEKAEGWVTWLKSNGFDTSLTKLDPVFATGAESVDFRMVKWKRIHGTGSASEDDMVANLKKMGVEVVTEDHGNHLDISFRAPTWRSIRVADHSQAEQWMAWLKQVGFETKHQH